MTIRRSCIPANLEELFWNQKTKELSYAFVSKRLYLQGTESVQLINHARVFGIRMWVGFLVSAPETGACPAVGQSMTLRFSVVHLEGGR
jgi:hypothetical protein